MKYKKVKEKTQEFCKDISKNKRLLNFILIMFMLGILVFGTWVRTQNLPILIDQTTGEYIPTALDPFYFLRITEMVYEHGGRLESDPMRCPSVHTGYVEEIFPEITVWTYKLANLFGDYSIQYIALLHPVMFFVLGIIVFFFLVWFLTGSKLAALLSSFFLTILPAYLYRSMAGFFDHESIGMFGFFLALLTLGIGLRYLENENKKKFIKTGLFGVIAGVAAGFLIAAWAGIAKIGFMIMPLSFLIVWFLKSKNPDKKILIHYLVFYILWSFFWIFSALLFKVNSSNIINAFVFSSNGIFCFFTLGFIIVDYFLILNLKKLKTIKDIDLKKYRIILSIFITVILGLILMSVAGKSIFDLLGQILGRITDPFGITGQRLGLTVAEQKQPYLKDWISQNGSIAFSLFIMGMLFLGIEISKAFRENKNKIIFYLAWVLLLSGIMLSSISAGSALMNGTSFLSKVFYLGSLLVFGIILLWLYFNSNFNIKSNLVILFLWMFFTLIAGRGAIRLFFVMAPFIALSMGFAFVKLWDYFKNAKDDVLKVILGIALIIMVVLSVIPFPYLTYKTPIPFSEKSFSLLVDEPMSFSFSKIVINSGKYTGPSANEQWQNSMAWVRENTPKGSIFAHWWDYGYWVQYLGERPTISDGGHCVGHWDHFVGRYILTTPYPETALSMMKAHNVSYLLIDQTEIGKYPAYSTIGSNDSWDRVSVINLMVSDEKNIRETSTGKTLIFQGVKGVEDDIHYQKNETQIFIPGATFSRLGSPNYKALIIGAFVDILEGENSSGIKQPEVVIGYNNQQIRIPMRYIYFQNKLYDFQEGLNMALLIIPSLIESEQGVRVNEFGAGIFLSERTVNSLVGELFLMNDAFGRYGEQLELVHIESNPIIKQLRAMGGDINEEFIFFRRGTEEGIHGPIKIYQANPNESIIAREEFLRTRGDFAEFDDLEFVRR